MKKLFLVALLGMVSWAVVTTPVQASGLSTHKLHAKHKKHHKHHKKHKKA